MAAPPDDTETLLARLEAELKARQSAVDARLAREKARLDAAQSQLDELVRRKHDAETQLALVMPRRDELLAEREALQRLGSRGNELKAALWGSAAIVLTAGATIPLAALLPHPALRAPVLIGEVAAMGLGYWLAGRFGKRRP